MEDKQADENRLIAQRRAKLHERRKETAVAFPNEFRRDSLADELHSAYAAHSSEKLAEEKVRVSVAGRMLACRVMGKNSFVKLQDRSGQIQLFVQRDVLGQDAYAEFKKWDVGDILGARGELMKTKTGELSIAATELRLLVKSLRPLPEKWHGMTDPELRLRRRYVDLIMSPEVREVFLRRIDIVRFVRSYLDALGFLEVETPMLHSIPGGAAARPFETHHHALDQQIYLRIAPELYLKRLLVGGFERIYELNRAFRNEGLSTRHNPEFTILELYQAYAGFEDVMSLTENLVRESARSLRGSTCVPYEGADYELGEPFAARRLEDLLRERHPELEGDRVRDAEALRGVCERHGASTEAHFGAGKLQFELFEKTVEHTLAGPVFVTHYPAEVSPLARANDADPFLADRFELFIGGREIANGFSELNDPEEQAARFRAQLEAREGGDDEAMRYDNDFIRALEHGMPPAAGLGVGIDRLVMFLTDSSSIRDVLLFPLLRPEEP